MSEVFKEEDFYKDNGWPTEEFSYCEKGQGGQVSVSRCVA